MRKKLLWMLCVLPCLLSAQVTSKTEMKKKSFMKQMVQQQEFSGNRMSVYSGSTENRPDTIYIYEGEEKALVNKVALVYSESGRIMQELFLADLNNDGLITDDEKSRRSIYQYADIEGIFKKEEFQSQFKDGEWILTYKVVGYYDSKDMYVPFDYYEYYAEDEQWLLDYKMTAVEFDAEKRPIVLMDSTIIESDTSVMKIDLGYNEQGLFNLFTSSVKADIPAEGHEWQLLEKIEFAYNENLKLEKDTHYDYEYDEQKTDMDWVYAYEIGYTYDEQGNLTSEIERSESGIRDAIYYTNIYSIPDANDVIPTIQSAIYPNPVSDVLQVTIEGADNAVVTLVNAAGSVVAQHKTTQSVVSIPVHSLAKGYYFLMVRTDKGVKTHKVIVR